MLSSKRPYMIYVLGKIVYRESGTPHNATVFPCPGPEWIWATKRYIVYKFSLFRHALCKNRNKGLRAPSGTRLFIFIWHTVSTTVCFHNIVNNTIYFLNTKFFNNDLIAGSLSLLTRHQNQHSTHGRRFEILESKKFADKTFIFVIHTLGKNSFKGKRRVKSSVPDWRIVNFTIARKFYFWFWATRPGEAPTCWNFCWNLKIQLTTESRSLYITLTDVLCQWMWILSSTFSFHIALDVISFYVVEIVSELSWLMTSLFRWCFNDFSTFWNLCCFDYNLT